MQRIVAVVVGAILAACLTVAAGALAQIGAGVPSANPRSGVQPTVVASGLLLQKVAVGSDPLENPVNEITKYGYLNDGPGTTANRNQPTKTEPDINTYLASTYNLGGPATGFDYGRHYLFQGHENATGNAYVTRVNLDLAAGDSKRITLLTPPDGAGSTGLTRVDGSTYDPFNKKVLFTQEGSGTTGGVVQVPVEFAAGFQPTSTLYGSIGRGGYEGIRVDPAGNLIIAEDQGGSGINVSADIADPNATVKPSRAPNSFIYKFIPTSPDNLAMGQLYALQVRNAASNPIVFAGHGGGTDAAPLPCTGSIPGVPVGGGSKAYCDMYSQDQRDLNTGGKSFKTQWVLVHDTAAGTTAFDANAAAKLANATPFKRPETVDYKPKSNFRTFFFTATGDNNNLAAPLAPSGAFGAIFRVDSDNPAAPLSDGQLTIAVLGDAAHAGFDNISFLDESTLLAGEDRGDTLHMQLNLLDSVWSYNINDGTSKRFLALGRTATAAADAVLKDAATPGFQNDGDEEPTGIIVADGSMSKFQILGTDAPGPDRRMFFTQQHGDNQTFEITAAPPPAPSTGPQGPAGATGSAGPSGPQGPAGVKKRHCKKKHAAQGSAKKKCRKK